MKKCSGTLHLTGGTHGKWETRIISTTRSANAGTYTKFISSGYNFHTTLTGSGGYNEGGGSIGPTYAQNGPGPNGGQSSGSDKTFPDRAPYANNGLTGFFQYIFTLGIDNGFHYDYYGNNLGPVPTNPNLITGTPPVPSFSGGNIFQLMRTPSVLGHIFRNAPGNINPGSIASQNRYINLFEGVANNSKNFNQSILSSDAIKNGVQAFTQTFKNGQVWVFTRGGKIFDAGVNFFK